MSKRSFWKTSDSLRTLPRFSLLIAALSMVLGACVAADSGPPVPEQRVAYDTSKATSGPQPSPTTSGEDVAGTATVAAADEESALPPDTKAPGVTETAVAARDDGTIIFNLTTRASLQGIDLSDGRRLVLADALDYEGTLPWSVSPDGRTIAVVAGVQTSGTAKARFLEDAALWLVGVDESNPRKLLDLVAGESPYHDSPMNSGLPFVVVRQPVSWTQDGREVLALSAHEGFVDLYAVAVDGSGVRRLTNSSDVELGARISPDGKSVAYVSTSSFGTGAGWGDVRAWVQPLNGGAERRQLIDLRRFKEKPSAARIIGWLDAETPVVRSVDSGGLAFTLWTTTPEGQPQALFRSMLPLHADVRDGELVFAATPGAVRMDDAAAQAEEGLYTWRPGQKAPTKVASLRDIPGEPERVYAAPQGQAVLLCPGHRSTGDRWLWTGKRIEKIGVEPGACRGVVWSPDGRLAVDSDIVNREGLVVRELQTGGVPAAWSGDMLYYFAPTDALPGQWQLYQLASEPRLPTQEPATAIPLGDPIEEQPQEPTLLPSR